MLRKEPRKTFLLLALCLCQVSSKEQQHLLRSRHASQADRPEKKHRVWIRYKGGQRDSTLKSLAAFSDGQEDDPTYLLPPVDIHYEFDRMNAVVVTATEEEIKLLTRNYPELIEEVVEDVKRYSMVVPNKKKQRSLQFGSQIVPYGISLVQADQVWAAGYTGQGVTVCVVDSGFDQTHEDFDSSHVTGNSLIDNVWGSDSNGHGTHVAGTVAEKNNAVGVVGVAPDATLHIMKVLGADGTGFLSDAVDALFECRDAGAKVINLSLGGPQYSTFEEEAYRQIAEDGILIVAAAGNDGETSFLYPASYDSVLSVGAVSEYKSLAYFSQRNSMVDLVGPGVDILSALPMSGQCTICSDLGWLMPVSEYAYLDGTSMASPHVAGVAALLWSSNPSLSANDIYNAMIETAEDLGIAGRDDSYGYGLVDAVAALEHLNGEVVPSVECEPSCQFPQQCVNGQCAIPTDLCYPCCEDGFRCVDNQCVSDSRPGPNPSSSNDACVDASPLEIDQIVEGTTIGMTSEDEPACGGASASSAADVWYSIDGTGQQLYATTCTDNTAINGDMDTQLSVFSGTCGQLQCVAGNDDSLNDTCDLKSGASFFAALGTRYYILVHGYGTSTGDFALQVKRSF